MRGVSHRALQHADRVGCISQNWRRGARVAASGVARRRTGAQIRAHPAPADPRTLQAALAWRAGWGPLHEPEAEAARARGGRGRGLRGRRGRGRGARRGGGRGGRRGWRGDDDASDSDSEAAAAGDSGAGEGAPEPGPARIVVDALFGWRWPLSEAEKAQERCGPSSLALPEPYPIFVRSGIRPGCRARYSGVAYRPRRGCDAARSALLLPSHSSAMPGKRRESAERRRALPSERRGCCRRLRGGCAAQPRADAASARDAALRGFPFLR